MYNSTNNARIVSGQGVAGVFQTFLSILQTFAVGLIIGAAMLWFFYLIVKYIWNVKNGKNVDDIKKQIPWAVVLLTVMISVYALINLFANLLSFRVGP